MVVVKKKKAYKGCKYAEMRDRSSKPKYGTGKELKNEYEYMKNHIRVQPITFTLMISR